MNNIDTARKWVHFVASRPEFPAGERLLAAFKAGHITHFCDCGCQTFEIEVPDAAEIAPLVPPYKEGDRWNPVVYDVTFDTNIELCRLTLMIFVDGRGQLSSIEILLAVNSFPIPDDLQVFEVNEDTEWTVSKHL